jgi:hypothetical protein
MSATVIIAGVIIGTGIIGAGSDRSATLSPMASAPTEPLSQRLAAIRDQLNLLADYL